MAVSNYSGLTITQPQVGIQITKVTDSQSDWSSVANSTYFYDKTDKLVHYKNGSGVVLEMFDSSNALYLLEAYASVTYTLPGSFTEDICRYSIVNNTVNVSSSWFNTSNYTFTPQKSGYWEITASYDVYRNSEASMLIEKNNSMVAAAGSFNAVAQQITKIVYLNGSTDFINIYNVGGAELQRAQFQSRSWFQARWVGE